LYLSAEDGGNIVAQRIEAATGNMGVAEDDVRQAMVDLRFRLVSEGCAALCEEDRDGIHATAAYHALLDYCQEARPRLVVIDPLAAFFHGDEDSAGEMAAFAQMLIRIARASGGAVLLVHHANKSGSRELDMMSARGSVALVAASRYVASMRPVAESTAKRLGCEDEIKQYVEVAVTKTSYGVAPDGSQFLHRGDCGILEVANLHRQHYLDIAERMAAALHETGAHLTAREIARAAGPRAKEVAEMLGDVGITERRRAVDAGLEFGLLEQRNVKEGQRGGSRYEIFPAVYS
jgi:RecA-family ATPase